MSAFFIGSYYHTPKRTARHSRGQFRIDRAGNQGAGPLEVRDHYLPCPCVAFGDEIHILTPNRMCEERFVNSFARKCCVQHNPVRTVLFLFLPTFQELMLARGPPQIRPSDRIRTVTFSMSASDTPFGGLMSNVCVKTTTASFHSVS